MKSLTLAKLEEDKRRLEQLVTQTQLQVHYYVGALAYINDNIKALKEVEDDRSRVNRAS